MCDKVSARGCNASQHLRWSRPLSHCHMSHCHTLGYNQSKMIKYDAYLQSEKSRKPRLENWGIFDYRIFFYTSFCFSSRFWTAMAGTVISGDACLVTVQLWCMVSMESIIRQKIFFAASISGVIEVRRNVQSSCDTLDLDNLIWSRSVGPASSGGQDIRRNQSAEDRGVTRHK